MNRNISKFLKQINNLIETESVTITYNKSNEHELICKIRAILEDDKLQDFECVEEIVCAFEAFGEGVALRHDF